MKIIYAKPTWSTNQDFMFSFVSFASSFIVFKSSKRMSNYHTFIPHPSMFFLSPSYIHVCLSVCVCELKCICVKIKKNCVKKKMGLDWIGQWWLVLVFSYILLSPSFCLWCLYGFDKQTNKHNYKYMKMMWNYYCRHLFVHRQIERSSSSYIRLYIHCFGDKNNRGVSEDNEALQNQQNIIWMNALDYYYTTRYIWCLLRSQSTHSQTENA